MTDYTHQEKCLAYLLRHDKNYAFDEHGWREVRDLVECHGFSCEELEYIVANSSKQRFEFSEDKLLIRARQGHSVKVDVELEEAVPPTTTFAEPEASVLPPTLMCAGGMV